MSAPQEERNGWTIQKAEDLLLSLKGVVSARVVARPGGEVEEIHVLTTEEVKPKQTVRNVESALLAMLDLEVDHRVISVATTNQAQPKRPLPDVAAVPLPPPAPAQSRLLFQSYRVESERSRKVRHWVEIEWKSGRFNGEAGSADLARAKLEGVAEATLDAVQKALANEVAEDGTQVALSLDGVKMIDAFDRRYVLVAVHAIYGRQTTSLVGVSAIEESADQAAIMASLQATDRWVRGRV